MNILTIFDYYYEYYEYYVISWIMLIPNIAAL